MVNFSHACSYRCGNYNFSFHTLPVGFPLPTISKNSLYTLFCPLILDHGVLLKISASGPKVHISMEEIQYAWHVIFQTLEATRVRWNGDHARADEVRQACG